MVPVGLNERLADRPCPDDRGDTNKEAFYPTGGTQDNGGGQRGQRRLRSGQNRKYKEQEKVCSGRGGALWSRLTREPEQVESRPQQQQQQQQTFRGKFSLFKQRNDDKTIKITLKKLSKLYSHAEITSWLFQNKSMTEQQHKGLFSERRFCCKIAPTETGSGPPAGLRSAPRRFTPLRSRYKAVKHAHSGISLPPHVEPES